MKKTTVHLRDEYYDRLLSLKDRLEERTRGPRGGSKKAVSKETVVALALLNLEQLLDKEDRKKR